MQRQKVATINEESSGIQTLSWIWEFVSKRWFNYNIWFFVLRKFFVYVLSFYFCRTLLFVIWIFSQYLVGLKQTDVLQASISEHQIFNLELNYEFCIFEITDTCNAKFFASHPLPCSYDPTSQLLEVYQSIEFPFYFFCFLYSFDDQQNVTDDSKSVCFFAFYIDFSLQKLKQVCHPPTNFDKTLVLSFARKRFLYLNDRFGIVFWETFKSFAVLNIEELVQLVFSIRDPLPLKKYRIVGGSFNGDFFSLFVAIKIDFEQNNPSEFYIFKVDPAKICLCSAADVSKSLPTFSDFSLYSNRLQIETGKSANLIQHHILPLYLRFSLWKFFMIFSSFLQHSKLFWLVTLLFLTNIAHWSNNTTHFFILYYFLFKLFKNDVIFRFQLLKFPVPLHSGTVIVLHL